MVTEGVMQQQAPGETHLGAQPKVVWDLIGSRLVWTLLHNRVNHRHLHDIVVITSYKLVAAL